MILALEASLLFYLGKKKLDVKLGITAEDTIFMKIKASRKVFVLEEERLYY